GRGGSLIYYFFCVFCFVLFPCTRMPLRSFRLRRWSACGSQTRPPHHLTAAAAAERGLRSSFERRRFGPALSLVGARKILLRLRRGYFAQSFFETEDRCISS
ncbi:unnamed protein product, partial [Scytosiphon promiscuus]